MKRIYLVALVLLMSSTVVLGQSKKKKTKSSSADRQVAAPSAGGYDSYAPETTTKTQAPVEQPATATESAQVAPSPAGDFMANESLVMDGIYRDENNVGNVAVPLSYVRQADVMWSKNVEEEIVLAEKPNRPLCHPNARFITVLLTALEKGELNAFAHPDDGGTPFGVPPMSKDQVMKVAGGRTDTIQIPDPYDPYIMRDTVVTEMFNPDLVDRIRVKEVWFFDKQRSVFEPRIIGIAPCKILVNKTTGDTLGSVPMFWIYYPEARTVLVNAQMFNRFNDSSNMNFDDFFVKRMFSAYVTKESNTEDLRIKDYAIGMERLYESERIRKKLMDYEQDLWEY